jgi:hypothetical protein
MLPITDAGKETRQKFQQILF